ncbi:hypothetical protein GCM10011348_33150 [Marinobacterium nitratireducens]|uniref:Uncharacterized protein n=2 Tax=Marinobacterium nitratireducens TaxID=518897 RepID=A0A918DW17_9GAMM|nr:hypothetical protein GCM10011348_33150 [Marinobacterium nitratireducens]
MIMKANEECLGFAQLRPLLQRIEACCESYDCDTLRALLLELVSGYQPQHEIRDPLHRPARVH